MKIPLMLGTKPVLGYQSPVVYLQEGSWELESNVKDSNMSVQASCPGGGMVSDSLFVYHGPDKLKIKGPSYVYIKVDKLGTEPDWYITAHLR